ncbi:hypothetical protein [Sphingobium sp. Z007]|nr:hypothetical protein [Sphingobium sp. Z007]
MELVDQGEAVGINAWMNAATSRQDEAAIVGDWTGDAQKFYAEG